MKKLESVNLSSFAIKYQQKKSLKKSLFFFNIKKKLLTGICDFQSFIERETENFVHPQGTCHQDNNKVCRQYKNVLEILFFFLFLF